MPKQVTVSLGGRAYTIREKPTGINSKWRERMRATTVMRTFESLGGTVDDLIVLSSTSGGIKEIDLGKALGLARILPAVVNGLTNSVDDIKALVYEYEPNLVAERAWLEENAYDSEFVAAFLEVLKLLYPIMGVWEMVTGFRGQQTPTNSPSPNGDSGLGMEGPKKRDPRPKRA